MILCFIITGLTRHFYEKLYPFLSKLEQYIELNVYLHTEKTSIDNKYLIIKNTNSIINILENSSYKTHIFDDLEHLTDSSISYRENNTIKQWYRIQTLSTHITRNKYDWFIRLRPDIDFRCSPEYFISIISKLNKNTLYIPEGNDIFHKNALDHNEHIKPLNDQMCIFSEQYFDVYCNTYEKIYLHKTTPIISEYILSKHLNDNNTKIERVKIPYVLNLSSVKILAITGDSGSGKTTLINAIKTVFPFDSQVILETDRYHRWERSDDKWKKYTHLNPEANNLEKMMDDTYRLKLGKDIYTIDYNHETGTFTKEERIESKDVVLLCGLHSLFHDKIRQCIDIKIFLDTDIELKKFWKIQRDTRERNVTLEEVLQKIYQRHNDYTQYILPQKDHANIVIQYSCTSSKLQDTSYIINDSDLEVSLEIKNELIESCFSVLSPFSIKIENINNINSTRFILNKNIGIDNICQIIEYEGLTLSKSSIINGHMGVIQLLVLRLLISKDI